jgi:hypothetical protein
MACLETTQRAQLWCAQSEGDLLLLAAQSAHLLQLAMLECQHASGVTWELHYYKRRNVQQDHLDA